MRTLVIIVGGFVLWGACLGIARLIAGKNALLSWIPTIVFVIVWFVLAAVNMWIGVTQAGYSFTEELPIFLLIYLLPVIVAVLVKWKLLPRSVGNG